MFSGKPNVTDIRILKRKFAKLYPLLYDIQCKRKKTESNLISGMLKTVELKFVTGIIVCKLRHFKDTKYFIL